MSPCIKEETLEDEIPTKALELKKRTNLDSLIGWDTFHVTVDMSWPVTGT